MRDTSGGDFDKDPWRDRIAMAIASVPELLDDAGKLQVSYAETMGKYPEKSYAAFERLGIVKDPRQFVMVDTNATRWLLAHRRNHPFSCVKHDIFGLATRLIADPSPIPYPLGACNLDMQEAAGLETWWADHQTSMREMGRDGQLRSGCGAFVVCLNLTLDRVKDPTPTDEILANHTRMFGDCYRDWSPQLDAILPAHAAAMIRANPDYTGRVGAYDIYRSGGRSLRMVTIKVLFKNGRLARYL